MAAALVGVTCMVTTGAAARAADDSDSPLYSAPFADPVAAAADFGVADGRTERPLGSGSATWSPGALTVDLDGDSQTLLEPDWGDGTIPQPPPDMAVEATVASNVGGPSRKFGVACRAERGPKGAYLFLVGPDGTYEIRRYDGIKAYGVNLVNPTKAKPTKAVDRSGPNVVRAECTGAKKAKLTLYVNHKKVVTATDPKPPPKKRAGDDAFLVTEVDFDESATVEYTSFAVYAL